METQDHVLDRPRPLSELGHDAGEGPGAAEGTIERDLPGGHDRGSSVAPPNRWQSSEPPGDIHAPALRPSPPGARAPSSPALRLSGTPAPRHPGTPAPRH